MSPTELLNTSTTPDSEIKRIFGEQAIISRIDKWNLIHLDNPTDREKARREKAFTPDKIFDSNCPICQLLKEKGGNIIYDGMF